MERSSVYFFLISITMGIIFIANGVASQNSTSSNPNDTIWCFQCNSEIDPKCYDLEKKDMKTSPLFKSCNEQKPPLPSNNYTWFCRKITQTIHDIGGKKRVIRKCGYVRGENECYSLSSPSHKDVVCQCFENGCNPAPQSAQAPPLALLTVGALAAVTVATLGRSSLW